MGQHSDQNRPPLDRVALTRELQRQLQRVGCYSGSISGVWSPSTRQAMKEFTEWVNASLPIAEPDHILLAMLQSHGEQACGLGCGASRSRSGNGLCQPNAIVARDATKLQPGTQEVTAALPPAPGISHVAGTNPASADVAATAGPGQPLAGRMGLAGPEHAATLPSADPQAVLPNADLPKDAAQLKVRAVGPRKHASGPKRPMGHWIFHDAPVDRVLAR